jgi:hypothetical protein
MKLPSFRKIILGLAPFVIAAGTFAVLFERPPEVTAVQEVPAPTMVRIGNPDGPCGATVRASSVEELEKVGINKWVERCNEAVEAASTASDL